MKNFHARSITRRIVGSFLKIALVFIVATYLLSIMLGIYIMYTPNFGLEYIQDSSQVYFIVYMIGFSSPYQVSRAALFASLITFYGISFVFAASLKTNIIRTLKKPWNQLSDLTSNWLTIMPILSGMILILVITLQSLQETMGVPTGNISFSNPYEELLALTYSPVIEEIGFRLTPIGTIVALSLIKHTRISTIIAAFIWPDEGKRLAGVQTIHNNGWEGIKLSEWIMIAITSSIFGLIHYLGGGGWDVGKISSAAVAGIALAIIYLWKGIHASILFHWFFNYYGYLWNLATSIHHSIFTYLNTIIYLTTLSLGIIGWILITKKLLINNKKNSP